MHFEREAAPSTDSQDFNRRLKVQAEQQAQELAGLLQQRIWLGEAMPTRPFESLWQHVRQWLACYIPHYLNPSRPQMHWPTDIMLPSVPPTEDAITVIEVEYQVHDVETPKSEVKSLEKEGLP